MGSSLLQSNIKVHIGTPQRTVVSREPLCRFQVLWRSNGFYRGQRKFSGIACRPLSSCNLKTGTFETVAPQDDTGVHGVTYPDVMMDSLQAALVPCSPKS